MIENEVEILVGHRAPSRLVVDLETAFSERQPVDRLAGARHGLRAGAHEGGEVRAFEARGTARQRDRRGAVVARDGDRQGAVRRDPEAQVETVELHAPSLHLRDEQGERIEPDLAGRRGEDRAPGGVAHSETAEPEADPPGIVHEKGRAEVDRVPLAGPLLQTRGDPVMQKLEIDRPVGEAHGERQRADNREQDGGFGDMDENVRDSSGAGASSRRRKPRPRGALRHPPHGGVRASARSDRKPTDQSGTILRWLKAA